MNAEHWKVGYTGTDGYESTAYINAIPDSNGIHEGVNKHTDEQVWVRWDGKMWRSTDPPLVPCATDEGEGADRG